MDSVHTARSRAIFERGAVGDPALSIAAPSTQLTGSELRRGSPVGGTFSRDEMNLAEFPLTVLSTRADPTVKTLEFSDHIRLKNGELVERKWIITGADKFGLPTSTDDDVILGLIRLTMDDGFRNRKVYFSRYELLKALRWSTEGRSYSRLSKSLDRLSGVRIRAANSFYDNSSKSYQTCNFGIVDAYELNDHRGKKGEDAPKSFFIWSEMLFDSFKSGFIKKLDLDTYFALRSSVSRRLYRYLDKNFYFRGTIEKPLLEFAFEKIGLSRTYKYVSSIRQQLEPAADELVRIGFLASYECVGKGSQTVIRFVSAQQQHIKNQTLPPSLRRSEPVAERASLERGIHDRSAERGESERTAAGGRIAESDSREHLAREARENAAPEFVQKGPEFVQKGSSGGEYSPVRRQNELVEALVSRGIGVKQAMRLIERRSVDDFEQIDCILRYYDTLVESDDPKVSRNKVGFLYRAVESPQRFSLPPAFRPVNARSSAGAGSVRSGSHPVPGSSRAERRRPEHRLVGESGESRAGSGAGRAGHADGRSGVNGSNEPESAEERDAYREFLDERVAQGKDELGHQALANLAETVERKLSLLKTVLSEQRFEEALQGCIREELLKHLCVPDLATWRRERNVRR